MELEDDLGDGLGEVVGRVGGANVECPAVGGGGVGVDVVFAEVEGNGAVGDWEAGCGVVQAVVAAGGSVSCRHGHGGFDFEFCFCFLCFKTGVSKTAATSLHSHFASKYDRYFYHHADGDNNLNFFYSSRRYEAGHLCQARGIEDNNKPSFILRRSKQS